LFILAAKLAFAGASSVEDSFCTSCSPGTIVVVSGDG
jgi:hypothetical protein